jgi:hypothetical protein
VYELFGSDHPDTFHNQRLYFDPSLGKFEPIVWEVMVLAPYKEMNQSYNWINQLMLLNPEIRNRKLSLQYELFTKIITKEYIEKYIKDYIERVGRSIGADKYLGAMWGFTYSEWMEEAIRIKNVLLARRYLAIEDSIRISNLTLSKIGSYYHLSGETPHKFSIVKVFLSSPASKLSFTTKEIKSVKSSLNATGVLNTPINISGVWEEDAKLATTRFGEYFLSGLKQIRLNIKLKLDNSNIEAIVIKNVFTSKLEVIKHSECQNCFVR